MRLPATLIAFSLLSFGLEVQGDDPLPNESSTLDAGWVQAVHSLRHSSDGKLLLASGEYFSMQVWDVKSGKLRTSSREDPDHNCWGNSIDVSSDSSLAYVGVAGEVQLWNVEKGTWLKSIDSGDKDKKKTPVEVRVASHPDNGIVAVASNSVEVKLWNVETGKLSGTLQAKSKVTRVVFSPDGKLLVGSGGQTAWVWDVSTQKMLHELKATTIADSQIRTSNQSLAISRDGRYCAFATDQGVISIWSLKESKELGNLSGRIADFTVDSKHLTIANGGDIEAVDMETLKSVRKTEVTKSTIHAVSHSPDGKTLAVGCDNGRILIWDAKRLVLKKE